MKKRKTLSKKIDRLKARLASDAKKLAKLTMKLGGATAGGKTKGKRKAAAQSGKASASSKKKSSADQKPEAPKPKKKLNLTPERRAQLAAAMKARWEAKRAAAAANSQGAPQLKGPLRATVFSPKASRRDPSAKRRTDSVPIRYRGWGVA